MSKVNAPAVRVELVDNWHACWPDVLESIAEQGQLDALNIDADGWLSARQVLLVAFARKGQIAGHLCFRIAPGADEQGRLGIDAELEAFGLCDPADSKASKIASALRLAAFDRAKSLRCRDFIGLAC